MQARKGQYNPLPKQLPSQGLQKQQTPQLKLYVYGSRQSSQFYLPQGRSQTRRPFCLSQVQQFTIEAQNSSDEKQKLIKNPLYRAQVYKIACGGLHTVVLTTGGQAFTFGCNDEGALGRKGEQCVPIRVDLEDPVDLISAGDNHTLFANSINGAVFFTGNYNFKRGQKMTDSIFSPIKFFTTDLDARNKDKPIQKLASGANHSIIMVDSKIFCRGEPDAYTTGRRINERRKTKSSLTFEGVGLSQVVDVWCGGYHSVTKIKKGKRFQYWAWGSNSKGQLGINNYENQPFPVEIEKLRSKDITSVAAGTDFTIFLTKQGDILSCGNNQNGNLGLGQDFVYQEHLSDLSAAEIKDRKKQQEKQKGQKEKEEKQRQKEQDQQKQVEKKLEQKLIISDKQKSELMQDIGDSERRQLLPDTERKEQDAKIYPQENLQQQKQQEANKKAIEEKMYVRSLRRVTFSEPPSQLINSIQCGSNFTMAWNSQNLYTWGFAMNYVLLNGSEDDDQATPFKVKDKIINYETIYSVAAGAQHVAYTSFSTIDEQNLAGEMVDKIKATDKTTIKGRVPRIFLDPKVMDKNALSKKKLTRKRQSPLKGEQGAS